MNSDHNVSKKLFVGGLSNDVTQEMLKKKFKAFGTVASIDIRKKKSLTDNSTNVFAFVTMDISQQNLNKCLRTLNDSIWNGSTMRLQVARESFLDRLAAERKDVAIVKEWSLNNASSANSNNKTSVTIKDKTKNAVHKYVSSEDDDSEDSEIELSDVKKRLFLKHKTADSDDDDGDGSSSGDDEDSTGLGSKKKDGRVGIKETNHKLAKVPAKLKDQSKVSKKRKASSDGGSSEDVTKSRVKKTNLESVKPVGNPKTEKNLKKRKAMSEDESDDYDDDDNSGDEDIEMGNKKQRIETEETMLAEKKRNLEILSSVVGKTGSEKRKLPQSFSKENTLMQRYDPSKPGHEQFEVQGQEESDNDDEDEDEKPSEPAFKKSKMEVDKVGDADEDSSSSDESDEDDNDDDDDDDEEEEDADDNEDEKGEKNIKQRDSTSMTMTTSDPKKFSEVSATVVEAFKKSEAFKLSSLFGNDDDDDDDDVDEVEKPSLPPAKRQKLMSHTLRWDEEEEDEDESSDDNDRSDDEGHMDTGKKAIKSGVLMRPAAAEAKQSKAKKSTVQSGKFFFEADDPRLSEGNSFKRTDDIEELRKKWEELRPQFVDSYRLRKKRYRLGKPTM